MCLFWAEAVKSPAWTFSSTFPFSMIVGARYWDSGATKSKAAWIPQSVHRCRLSWRVVRCSGYWFLCVKSLQNLLAWNNNLLLFLWFCVSWLGSVVQFSLGVSHTIAVGCGLELQSSNNSSELGVQMFHSTRLARTDAGYWLGALELLTRAPMWLRLLIAWVLGSKRKHPKSVCSKRPRRNWKASSSFFSFIG